MGFMADLSRLMKVATKPDRRELWLVIRVTALGMSALGLLGFLIKLAGSVIFTANHPTNTGTTGTTAVALIIQLVHVLVLTI